MNVGLRYDWASQPLGQVPDRQLARTLGCRRQTVLAARQRLGILPSDPSRTNKGIDWDTVGLGTRSDVEIADELDVARTVVILARQRRGIAPHTPREAPVIWAQVPLGTLPDAALAGIYGVSQTTVTRHRNKQGVAPFKATFLTTEGDVAASHGEALIDLFWHEQGIAHKFQVPVGPFVADWVLEDGLLVEYAGFIESRDFGERYKARLDMKLDFYRSLGRKVKVIYPNDLASFTPSGQLQTTDQVVSGGIDWKQQPLGSVSDGALAQQLGVAQTTVTRWRNRFGITPFCPPDRDWGNVPLGQEPDPVIAARLGVSKETVRRARHVRGIPSRRSRHAA